MHYIIDSKKIAPSPRSHLSFLLLLSFFQFQSVCFVISKLGFLPLFQRKERSMSISRSIPNSLNKAPVHRSKFVGWKLQSPLLSVSLICQSIYPHIYIFVYLFIRPSIFYAMSNRKIPFPPNYIFLYSSSDNYRHCSFNSCNNLIDKLISDICCRFLIYTETAGEHGRESFNRRCHEGLTGI